MNTPKAAPQYRYYDLVMAAFVTILICSNLVGPAKIAQLDLPLLGVVTFGAGVLFFPISYVFGDVLTEVYGYARARRVIWAGFAGLIFEIIWSRQLLRVLGSGTIANACVFAAFMAGCASTLPVFTPRTSVTLPLGSAASQNPLASNFLPR